MEKNCRVDLVICSHSREEKTLFYSQINTILSPESDYVLLISKSKGRCVTGKLNRKVEL